MINCNRICIYKRYLIRTGYLNTLFSRALRLFAIYARNRDRFATTDTELLRHQFTPGRYEVSRRENRCLLAVKNARAKDHAIYKCEVDGDVSECSLIVDGWRWAR